MTLLLTPSQERSLDLSTHLSVTANAGAGKTSVLARRFVEIFLTTDAKLSEVVAITFTEQAAGELRKRIHDVILGRESGAGRADRLRLMNLRNQLSSAVIGTIHSFCARILRMYPAEADIDASFGVVDGQERARLVAESVAETFSEFMGHGDGAGPAPEFRELLRAIPPARLERFLLKMFAQREQLHRLLADRPARAGGGGAPGTGEADPGGAERAGLAAVSGIADAIARRAADSGWIGMAKAAAAAAAGKDAAKLLGLLGAGGARPGPPGPAGQAGPTGHPGPPGLAEMGEILSAAGGLIFTKEGEFRKSFLGTAPVESLPRGAAEYLREFDSRYAGILRALREPDAGRKILGYDRLEGTLLGLFRAAQERYRVKKDDLGLLDFEDLQVMTAGLLGRGGVRERIRAEYRWFLVDEFQDTNDLQYGLLKALTDDCRSGNLFIVGDPKQSIYGFRNADVGVFYDAREDIAREIRRSGEGRADGGSVVLEESFRPLPAVAAFVNAVFSVLMRRGGSRFEVDYDRIVVGRESAGTGEVGLLLVPAGAETDRASVVRAECALLAGKLGEIARGGGGRSFGECAVLLRDRTNLPPLERALEEAGIPYLLAGGVGFFQTQEVYDFLNYLRFLTAPDDDPALAGILRSPFFGLTDADLYELSFVPGPGGRPGARFPGGMPLWERVRRAAVSPGSHAPLLRAGRILGEHLSVAGRIPVPRLLRKIAADTGWVGTMAGLSHGPQPRENFLKLLDLARRAAATGPSSLYDFTVHLGSRSEEEEREGQAATAPGGKAVRVMTVHAAKGLEFPVVFLPFLDRASRPDHEPIVDPAHGIGFRPGGGGDGEGEHAPRHDFLRALSEEKRIAEEKRVFYVGCTRAKDVLVLSGSEGETIPRDSPLGWLRAAMEALGVRERDSAFDFGDQPLTRLVRKGGKQEHIAGSVRLVVRAGRPGEAPAAPAGETAPGRAARPSRILAGPIPDTSGGETYSATRLAAYAACPAGYYLTYVVGGGAGHIRPDDADADAAARGAGEASSAAPWNAALEGELTHRVLSELGPAGTGWSPGERIAALAASLGAGPSGPELARRVAAHAMAFLGSDAGREILSGKDARTEYQISALLGDAVVTGKIDRIWRGSGGRIEFVDYKTDSVAPGGTAARAAAHSFQLAVYAYLISRLHSQPDVRGTLLFLNVPSEPVVLNFDAAEIARTERRVSGIVDAIRHGRFDPPPITCAGCPAAGGKRCPVIPPRP
jgi:ATP-dependent helicase/nuclease subunit A